MPGGSRSYRICHEGDYWDWLCGTDSLGRQVFLYEGYPNRLTGAFFDGAGNLFEVVHRPLPPYSPTGGPGWREAERQNVEVSFARWREELGFQPGTIEVRCTEFADVLIYDLDSGLEDFIAGVDVEEMTPDERKRREDWLTEWRENQMYVLHFGKEYWMLGSGEDHTT